MENRYLFKAKRVDNGEWEIGSLIILPNGKYEIANGCANPPDSDPMWKSEMAKFDNNQTHKLLKSRKSYDDKYLYDFTIDYINKQIPIDESHGRYPYITKEKIAKVLKCKPSDLDKTFMRLNREGILSQAKHRRMHDTARYGNIEETLSYDYGNSDWTPDAYDILAKAPVLTA